MPHLWLESPLATAAPISFHLTQPSEIGSTYQYLRRVRVAKAIQDPCVPNKIHKHTPQREIAQGLICVAGLLISCPEDHQHNGSNAHTGYADEEALPPANLVEKVRTQAREDYTKSAPHANQNKGDLARDAQIGVQDDLVVLQRDDGGKLLEGEEEEDNEESLAV